jgi:hypothetical protein
LFGVWKTQTGGVVIGLATSGGTPLNIDGWAHGVYFLKTIDGVACFVKN